MITNELKYKSAKKSNQIIKRIKFIVEKDSVKNCIQSFSNNIKLNILKKDSNNLRRSKHDLRGRDYLCTTCWKSYLSYAAIYVHLKNKHKSSITDIKLLYIKRNKISPLDVIPKLREKIFFSKFEEKFELVFKKVFNDVYLDNASKYSEYYRNSYDSDYKSHPLFFQTLDIHRIFKDKILLKNTLIKDIITNIDTALSVYIFGYWCFNHEDENITNLKISFLFREFLNFIGWEHLNHLANYKIVEKNLTLINQDYSKHMMTENLPELVDDFIGIFLKEDSPSLGNSLSLVKNYICEFCNLLYSEKIVNYLIEPLS